MTPDAAESAKAGVIPPTRPYVSPEARARVLERISGIFDGWLSRGPLVEELETGFADRVGVGHAVAVSSGGAALFTAFRALGVGGGEVVMPTMTCFACASTLILAGGRPRPVNVDPDTMCLDLRNVREGVGPETRGVLVVHLGGRIAPEIERIRDLCRERGIFLLEDAAHATGASAKGRPAGSFGDLAVFSFHPTKIMTTGEGGMIVTDDADLADRCRRFREGGAPEEGLGHDMPGLNVRMDEMSAALGLEQLRELDGMVDRRNEIVARYREHLRDVPVEILAPSEESRPSYWKVYTRLPEAVDRDALAARMLEEGIDVRPAYRPLLHGHPALADFVPDPGRLEPSDRAMNRLICLPIFVSITEEQIECVVRTLASHLGRG